MRKTLTLALKNTLPVCAGYIVLGTGFGLLMASKGYSWIYSLLMSLFIYAGSMQYAAVSLIASAASLLTIAIMTLAINIRHLFYGLSMLGKYKQTGKAKGYLAFSLTDETFALLSTKDVPAGVRENRYFVFISAFNQFYWVLGTLIGAMLSKALPYDFAGIDFSMTALFAITVLEQWERNKNHLSALIGGGCSLLCLFIFGPSSFLLPSLLSISTLLLLLRRYL